MIDYNNPLVEFTAHDRCDRCGAQAYVVAQRDGLELMFCRHHLRRYNYALELDGWDLTIDVVGIAKLTGEEVLV